MRKFYMTSLVAIVTLAGSMALAAEPAWKGTWTNPRGDNLPAEFQVQGEYVGSVKGGGKLGCQVIALGKGVYQAVIYPGGLPGDGWDGKNKILIDGTTKGEATTFKPAEGKKRYLGRSAAEFSATQSFPPQGHKPYAARITGNTLTGKTDDGKSFELTKTERKSPTLGKKPLEGALVLFDGTGTEHFQGGRLDETTKLLNTDGKDIKTRQKFNDYQMHIEFMLPFRPDARGQGRGNSGFYQVDHYEVQVLDSFGLEGLDNECGGVYKKAKPKVNMCYPPLTWQTYDVEFRNAVVKDGKKIKKRDAYALPQWSQDIRQPRNRWQDGRIS